MDVAVPLALALLPAVVPAVVPAQAQHADAGAETGPCNVLLIVADDLGPEWVSCYGADGIETPHIDRLADDGLRLTNAYSMPKCTPTRVTLLTGQYPFRHGWVNHWDVPRWGGGCHFDPDRNPSVARALRDAGYATAIAGKWQINDFRVQPRVLDEHGFDDWCVWTGFETGNPPSAERYRNPFVQTRAGRGTRAGGFGPDVFTGFLVDFIRRHADRPWLCYYPMVLPHGPLTTTPAEPDAAGKLGRFRAMVRAVDGAVSRLRGAIEELGLTRRTHVIFTSDNGTARGIRGRRGGREVRGGKGRLTENGPNVPFVVAGPGIASGRTSDALLDFTDLLPTLCAIAGADPPASGACDGHDQLPVWRDAPGATRRSWILAMGGGVAVRTAAGVVPARRYADRVVRDERFKLWVEDGAPSRLFDLIADPGEQHDLFDSARDDVVAARARLRAVIAGLPSEDARPRYAPTPQQPWDRPVQRRHAEPSDAETAGAATAGAAIGGAATGDAATPNVVLLMADDLGWGDVGFNGGTAIRTPNLDAMAAAGLVFDRFYAAAPVCSPTRGSCLTGRHPSRYGIRGANDGHLPAREHTLAEILAARGYRTGHFGKWHLGTLTETLRESNRGGPRGAAHYAPPWEHGFSVAFSTEAKVPTFDPMRAPGTGAPYGTHYWTGPGQRATDGLDGDDSRVIVDRVEPFVRSAVADRTPFFAVVWFHAPHLPVVAGPRHLAMYRGGDARTRHYRGTVTAMDEQVGRLRALLRELGVERDTMVWFCSDNGPEGRRGPGSAGPFRGRKRSLYEGGIRVPAVLEWPGEVAPGRSAMPVCTSDYLPTVLARLGVATDGEDDRPLDGIDVSDVWRAGRTERGAPIGFRSRRRGAWVEDRYKLLVDERPAAGTGRRQSAGTGTTAGGAAAAARYELYDLRADPAERQDRAAGEAALVRRLADAYARWLASCARSARGED